MSYPSDSIESDRIASYEPHRGDFAYILLYNLRGRPREVFWDPVPHDDCMRDDKAGTYPSIAWFRDVSGRHHRVRMQQDGVVCHTAASDDIYSDFAQQGQVGQSERLVGYTVSGVGYHSTSIFMGSGASYEVYWKTQGTPLHREEDLLAHFVELVASAHYFQSDDDTVGYAHVVATMRDGQRYDVFWRPRERDASSATADLP